MDIRPSGRGTVTPLTNDRKFTGEYDRKRKWATVANFGGWSGYYASIPFNG